MNMTHNWTMRDLAIFFFRAGGYARFAPIRDEGFSPYELAKLGLVTKEIGRWTDRYFPSGDLKIEIEKLKRDI